MSSTVNYSLISIPESRPPNWPFENWADPKTVPLQWMSLCLFIIDQWLEAQNRLISKRPAITKFVFSFTERMKSYAQIKIVDGTAFIAVDSHAFIHAMHYAMPQPAEVHCHSRSDMGNVEYRIAVMTRAANAVLMFILCHELAHLNAGHFQIIRDHVRTREYVRAMEFSADRAALSQAFNVLLDPLVRSGFETSLIHDVSKAFGKSLLLMLIRKYNPNQIASLYPDAGERILLLAGSCLDGCAGSTTDKMILASIHYAIISGMKIALDLANEDGSEIVIPPDLQPLLIETMIPQRVNCVGCSVWARRIYEAALPKVEEVLRQSDVLQAYNINPFGFNINGYRMAETYRDRERHVCRPDHPFFLSRLAKRLQVWWSGG